MLALIQKHIDKILLQRRFLIKSMSIINTFRVHFKITMIIRSFLDPLIADNPFSNNDFKISSKTHLNIAFVFEKTSI